MQLLGQVTVSALGTFLEHLTHGLSSDFLCAGVAGIVWRWLAGGITRTVVERQVGINKVKGVRSLTFLNIFKRGHAEQRGDRCVVKRKVRLRSGNWKEEEEKESVWNRGAGRAVVQSHNSVSHCHGGEGQDIHCSR